MYSIVWSLCMCVVHIECMVLSANEEQKNKNYVVDRARKIVEKRRKKDALIVRVRECAGRKQ